jgi:hypothetical protein
MVTIIHKRFGVTVEFDYYYLGYGIMGAHPEVPRIKWESIYCVIGYPKPYKVFSDKYGITVGFEDKKDDCIYVEVVSTNNEWEYRYFLEKMVNYLKRKYGAIGGESWCSISKDEAYQNHYSSYMSCRTIANKVNIDWFEQDDYEHILVANDFLNKVLIPDGSEQRQIWDALLKLRLQWDKNGKFNLTGSHGYNILYNHMIEMYPIKSDMNKSSEK